MEVDEIRHKHPKVFRQWQEQPENICPPEGEMLCDARGRIKTALTKLVRKQKVGTIGLVLPEPLASLAESFLTGCRLGELWKLGETCGQWQAISVDHSAITHRGTAVKLEKGANDAPVVPIGLN
jgi:phosphoserine phosphatase